MTHFLSNVNLLLKKKLVDEAKTNTYQFKWLDLA